MGQGGDNNWSILTCRNTNTERWWVSRNRTLRRLRVENEEKRHLKMKGNIILAWPCVSSLWD